MSSAESIFKIEELYVQKNGCVLADSLAFSLPRGSWLSIIGPNGAGKSTMLKVLAGLIESKSVRIWLGEKRLDQLPQRVRACYLAYVPQRFEALLPFTVFQFLSFALYAENSPAAGERVGLACEIFRLERFRDRSIQQLSVGELQRVLLAAAFVQGSEVLLLDEPSSALDPFEEVQMIQILKELIRDCGRTVIFVSHNLSAALSFADQVLILDCGKDCFQGTPRQAIDAKVLQQVFQQEFFVREEDQQIHITPDYLAPVHKIGLPGDGRM